MKFGIHSLLFRETFLITDLPLLDKCKQMGFDAVEIIPFYPDNFPAKEVKVAAGNLGLKSSTLIYGAQPGNSAFLREDHPLNAKRNFGTLRDLLEIESFIATFRGQSPEVKLTLLRFANILGPTVESPLTRFLRDDTAPMLLGFVPVVQVIHEEDVVNALAHAAIYDVPGTYNVAAQGAMPLFKLTGLATCVPRSRK